MLLRRKGTASINQTLRFALPAHSYQSVQKVKTIKNHSAPYWDPYLEEAEHLRHTDEIKQIYAKRKGTIERVFAGRKKSMVCGGQTYEALKNCPCRRCLPSLQ